MKIKIIGAGMAGLISGHMLRRFNPQIFEAAPSLPDNHSALLRFRSDAVARATAIPFSEVTVRKGLIPKNTNVLTNEPTIFDINAYSNKVSGVVSDRSVADLSTCKRYVAPPDFLNQLSDSCPAKIFFDYPVDGLAIASKPKDEIWISTIPMPLITNMVGLRTGQEYPSKPITTLVAKIHQPLTSVYQTVYIPHDSGDVLGNFYRVSISGDQLIMEGTGMINCRGHSLEETAEYALRHLFGILSPVVMDVCIKTQKFGKMVKIDEQVRRANITDLTENYGIYSLGRYATWRPLLLDDVVKDIEVIERLMKAGRYGRSLS